MGLDSGGVLGSQDAGQHPLGLGGGDQVQVPLADVGVEAEVAAGLAERATSALLDSNESLLQQVEHGTRLAELLEVAGAPRHGVEQDQEVLPPLPVLSIRLAHRGDGQVDGLPSEPPP